MGILLTVSTVLFIILCILLMIIILLQSDKSAGMGILGGSSQSAFGSSTVDVITKITAVMVALFMLGSLGVSTLSTYRSRMIKKELTGTVETKGPGTVGEQKGVTGKPESAPADKTAAPAPAATPGKPAGQK